MSAGIAPSEGQAITIGLRQEPGFITAQHLRRSAIAALAVVIAIGVVACDSTGAPTAPP